MAERKKNSAEKSRPFTSINLYLPVKISICGTLEMQKKWKKFFKSKNAPSKDEFILANFRRDLEVESNAEIFDDSDSRRWDRKKLEDLMVELRYPNIQEYFNFILDRAIEESSDEVKDNEA